MGEGPRLRAVNETRQAFLRPDPAISDRLVRGQSRKLAVLEIDERVQTYWRG